MRKLIFSVAFLSALFASCKVGKDGDKAITLVMAEVNPPETIAPGIYKHIHEGSCFVTVFVFRAYIIISRV